MSNKVAQLDILLLLPILPGSNPILKVLTSCYAHMECRPFSSCPGHLQNISRLPVLQWLCSAISVTDFNTQSVKATVPGRLQLLAVAVMWPWLVTPLQAQLQHKGTAGQKLADEMGLAKAASLALQEKASQRQSQSPQQVKQAAEDKAKQAQQAKTGSQKPPLPVTNKRAGFGSLKAPDTEKSVPPRVQTGKTRSAAVASAVVVEAQRLPSTQPEVVAGSTSDIQLSVLGLLRQFMGGMVSSLMEGAFKANVTAPEDGNKVSEAGLNLQAKPVPSGTDLSVGKVKKIKSPQAYQYRDPGRKKLNKKK